jgi:hypothetical protein
MEYIIDTLEGRKGLIKDIEERNGGAKVEEVDGIMIPGIRGTLSFLAELAGALPDPGLGAAVSRKVNGIITDIEKIRTGDKGNS